MLIFCNMDKVNQTICLLCVPLRTRCSIISTGAVRPDRADADALDCMYHQKSPTHELLQGSSCSSTEILALQERLMVTISWVESGHSTDSRTLLLLHY